MDNIILKNEYVEIKFDDKTKIYTSIYLANTEFMTDNEWQDLMCEIKTLIEKVNPKYIIDDNKQRLYSYSPDMQEWTLKLFVESWNRIGLVKYVQITPIEIINRLTSDQILDSAVNKFNMNYKHKFVSSYQDALKWLNQID